MSEQRLRLLIISNDSQLIEQLTKEAAIQKMQIETAMDNVIANSEFVENILGAIASSNPDLVLLDLCVPDGTKNQLFAADADDCVSKPIAGTKLISRIFNRLERAQLFWRMAETEA